MPDIDLEDSWPEAFALDFEALRVEPNEDLFMEAAVEFCKEGAILATLAAALIPHEPFHRNDAILCGLLVRSIKLTDSLLLETVNQKGTQQLAIDRQLLESLANLVFLGSGQDDQLFEAYVLDSLVTEREFLRVVDRNIRDRGEEELPIEGRIQRSIERAAKVAGVDLDEVPGRRAIGWPSVEERLARIGWTDAYVAFRMGSAAIHGGWSDLQGHHLEQRKDGLFEPKFNPLASRAEPLTTATELLLTSIDVYLRELFMEAVPIFAPKIDSLRQRVAELGDLYESYVQDMSSRQEADGDDRSSSSGL